MRWLTGVAAAVLLSGCGVSVSGNAASPTVEVSVAASAVPGCAEAGDISGAAASVTTALSSGQDWVTAAQSLVDAMGATAVPDAAIADRDELLVIGLIALGRPIALTTSLLHVEIPALLAFAVALGRFNATLLTVCPQ